MGDEVGDAEMVEAAGVDDVVLERLAVMVWIMVLVRVIVGRCWLNEEFVDDTKCVSLALVSWSAAYIG